MIMREVLGTYLRGQRREQGLTLRDVASLAGCSLGYLSELERGKKESGSEILTTVINSLGLQWSEVFTALARQAEAYENLSDLAGTVSNTNQGGTQ